MSETAKSMVKNYVNNNFEDMYQYRKFNTRKVKGAQEAHECIRPTKINKDYSHLNGLEKVVFKTFSSAHNIESNTFLHKLLLDGGFLI